MRRRMQLTNLVCVFSVILALISTASASVYQWELSDPSDPNSSRQKSSTPCKDGKDVTAEPGVSFFALDLSKAYLINADLSKAGFLDCILHNADLSGVDLRDGRLAHTGLTNATLVGANLQNVDANFSIFANADLSGAIIQSAHFFGDDLNHADLVGADLRETSLHLCDLTNANLSGSHLDSVDMYGTDLTNADFTYASITSATFDNSILTGAQLMSTANYCGKNLYGVGLDGADLTACNFAGFNMQKMRLYDCNISGVDFTGASVTEARFGSAISAKQFYSTLDYQLHDLHGMAFENIDLSGWDFSGCNLKNTCFAGSNLANADFERADIVGADFSLTNVAAQQLYSTASYQSKKIPGLLFWGNNLTGWDLRGQNLCNSFIAYSNLSKTDLFNAKLQAVILENVSMIKANLTSADLSGTVMVCVDARGVKGFNLTGTTALNLIQPDGVIHGLNLSFSNCYESDAYYISANRFVLHNYVCDEGESSPIVVHIQDSMKVTEGGLLELVFDENAWNSTISFDAGIDVTLGGILKLEFEDGTDVLQLVGTTFHVFDWTGVKPEGKFNVESDYAWNLDALYSTGEITLVPEPSLWGLVLLGLLWLGMSRRKREYKR